MWFKNAQIYGLKLTPEQNALLKDEVKFEEVLQQKAFRPCMAQELSTIGFAPLFGRDVPAMSFSTGPHHFVRLLEETKLLPSSVIKVALEEEVEKKESALGRDLQKNEIQALKTAITGQLLERAFSSQRDMLVYINSEQGLAVVSVSSAKRAERAIAMLREAFGGSFPAKHFQPRCVVEDRLTSWIEKQELPQVFALGSDATLKSNDDLGATVRVSRDDLLSDEVLGHIKAGKVITELQLIFEDSASFVLTSDLVLKRLRPEDQYLEQNLPEKTDDAVADMQSILMIQADLLDSIAACLIKTFDCELD